MRVLVGLFVLSVAARAHGAGLTVAILNIGGSKADEAVRTSIAETLATELGREKRFKIVTRSEIESVLGLEKLKDSLGCSDASCLAEVGGALGVDRIVA